MRFFAMAVGGASVCVLISNCGSNPSSGGTDASTSSSVTSGAGASGSGAGGSGAGGGAEAAIIDKFCHDLAQPLCEAYWACCSKPDPKLGSSVDDCKDAIVARNGLFQFCAPPPAPMADRRDLEASLRAGRTIFDQARFDACLDRLKAMSPGGSACVELAPESAYWNCMSAFQGQLAPGAACSWNDWMWVDSVMECQNGRCEHEHCVPFLKLGDTCPTSMNWGGPADQACNYGNNEWCKGPFPWGGGDAGTTGVCAPRKEVGDACDPANDWNECKSTYCDGTGKCALPSAEALCYSF